MKTRNCLKRIVVEWEWTDAQIFFVFPFSFLFLSLQFLRKQCEQDKRNDPNSSKEWRDRPEFSILRRDVDTSERRSLEVLLGVQFTAVEDKSPERWSLDCPGTCDLRLGTWYQRKSDGNGIHVKCEIRTELFLPPLPNTGMGNAWRSDCWRDPRGRRSSLLIIPLVFVQIFSNAK